MRYPKFLQENNYIGITAPSAGVGKHLDDYLKSIENIHSYGFKTLETKSVRNDSEVSTTSVERVNELNSLFQNEDIKMIMCATGGDFLYDIIPHLDYKIINNNPKWVMGSSDATTLLYTITTTLDIATIYGHSASSFDSKNLHQSQKTALDILQGKIHSQKSYELYEENRKNRIDNNYNLDKEVKWESNKSEFEITGRIIGGCLDCLRYLPGTRYDKTKDYIEKYKEDGIIWYFDVFSLTTEDFYLTLIQLKETGWFKFIKGVIVGRVMFPNSFTSMTYKEALEKIFKDIPIIFNADIGHVPPKMTIINGSFANIVYKNNQGIIDQRLK